MATFQKVKAAVKDEPEADDGSLEEVVAQLDEVTVRLAKNYDKLTKAKKAHEGDDGLRGKFFSLATEYARLSRPRERKVIEVEAKSEQIARSRALTLHPTFRVDELEETAEGEWTVSLSSDPAFDKVVFVNSAGYEVIRAVGERGAKFDVENFMADHPDVADEVVDVTVSWTGSSPLLADLKEVSIADLIDEEIVAPSYALNEKKAEAYIKAHPEYMDVFAEYRIPGTPSLSLPAIKKAKESK